MVGVTGERRKKKRARTEELFSTATAVVMSPSDRRR